MRFDIDGAGLVITWNAEDFTVITSISQEKKNLKHGKILHSKQGSFLCSGNFDQRRSCRYHYRPDACIAIDSSFLVFIVRAAALG